MLYWSCLLLLKCKRMCWHYNIYELDKLHFQLSWAWKKFYSLWARVISERHESLSVKPCALSGICLMMLVSAGRALTSGTKFIPDVNARPTFNVHAKFLCTMSNKGQMPGDWQRNHIKPITGHYRLARETPSRWRFADGPIVARFYVLTVIGA